MSSFTQFSGQLHYVYDREASKLLGSDYNRVTKGFRYYIGGINSDLYVDVQAGFLSDGASSPRLLWSIIPPWGEYGQAVVLHDWLCEHPYAYSNKDGVVREIRLDRKQVDNILYEANDVLNVTKWKKVLIKGAVEAHRILKNPGTGRVNWEKRKLETS